ncbi:MAG: T9SS type A sorting domain-containing protein, partial [Saprospiraceae bacterium]|nr:T9SS type A sorting domain-containing protein [Saprospiraceae bacterium]
GVTRWWVATDSAGNVKSCSQQITVEVINTTSVTFPANITVNACGDPADLLPAATGQPLIGGQSCSPLSVNYTDQIFSGAGPTCFRVFRSWKVIDHCIYNPNGGTQGIWEQVQIIDVQDQTPPSLLIIPDLVIAADPNLCMGVVSMPDVVTSDCSDQITVTHNSTFSSAGNSVNASGLYPHGVHFVVFTATDDCGNSAQHTLRITVKDQTPPTAVCLTGMSANIGPAGTAVLDPQDFDGGCVDPCSPQNSLIYSITPSIFDCAALGLQVVTLTVQDTAGWTNSCSTQVLIKDPGFICTGGGLIVEGRILTETGLPVRNIPVSLTGDGYYEETPCDTTGHFLFQDIPANAPYILRAANNANWLNGVTTYDLVLISRHILGYDTLDSPYQMIAADANRSGSITTFDIVQLRKIILGILDSMPNNTSWRFVDSAYVFPNPLNPFSTPIPEDIVFQPLTTHQPGKDFIGIKVGDVNATTNPAEARSLHDTLYLGLSNRQFVAGDRMEIPLLLENWTMLEGLQGELNIDPAILMLEGVDFSRPDLFDEQHVALTQSGSLVFSWDQALPPAHSDGPILFTLRLRALMHGTLETAVSLKSARLRPEVYRGGDAGMAALALRFEGELSGETKDALSVYPNPTTGDFTLDNPFGEHTVTLRILNALGQVVMNQQGVFPEKANISLPAEQTGVFFVSLCNGENCLQTKVTRCFSCK